MDFLEGALQQAPYLVIGVAGMFLISRHFLKHISESETERREWSKERHTEFFTLVEKAAARSDATIDNNTQVMGAVLERLREEK